MQNYKNILKLFHPKGPNVEKNAYICDMRDIKFLDLQKVTDRHGAEIEAAISRVTRSGWYLQGIENQVFESEYAKYVGTRHAIGCANGLDALTLTLRALLELGRLVEGDEVIVPANTYIATILAITENGLKPVLVEPDPDTLQIDANRIEEAISGRTRALLIVHLYGRCAYSARIEDICRRRKLMLIEDNAQAHGCIYNGKRTGSLGLAGCHSFYPGKNLGALGDGGAVTTDDPRLARTIRTLANYGSSQKYIFPYRGRNSRLDEIQAAVLGVKLKYLDEDNDRRRQIARIYYDNINNPDVILPTRTPEEENVYHLFPVLSRHRDDLQKYLLERGINTLIHYPVPPHRQECYSEWNGISLPITERIASQELSLPISQVMSEEEALYVAETVNNFDHASQL